MTPSELILAIGRVLRAAADEDGPGDDYRRGQLLSAYSIARHLSAEEAARDELIEWFQAEAASVLEGDPEARSRILAAHVGTEIGEVLVDVLEGLGDSVTDQAMRRRLQQSFVEMADREVAALARAGH